MHSVMVSFPKAMALLRARRAVGDTEPSVDDVISQTFRVLSPGPPWYVEIPTRPDPLDNRLRVVLWDDITATVGEIACIMNGIHEVERLRMESDEQ